MNSVLNFKLLHTVGVLSLMVKAAMIIKLSMQAIKITRSNQIALLSLLQRQ